MFPSAEKLGEAFKAKDNVLTNASGSKYGRLGDFFRTWHASARSAFVRIKTKVIGCIASDSMKYSQQLINLEMSTAEKYDNISYLSKDAMFIAVAIVT